MPYDPVLADGGSLRAIDHRVHPQAGSLTVRSREINEHMPRLPTDQPRTLGDHRDDGRPEPPVVSIRLNDDRSRERGN